MKLANLPKLSFSALLTLSLLALNLQPAHAGLYVFSTHTFTNCSATGYTGPLQAACRTAYSTTWDENDAYFKVNNGLQIWTVPATGLYTIKAIGAAGGQILSNTTGLGASIQGDFNLSQGETVTILVGQKGINLNTSYGQGGGGGSFVLKSDQTKLVIAGGGGTRGNGGGNSNLDSLVRVHADASITTTAKDANTYVETGGLGGTNGNAGGSVSSSWNGYAGSGFLQDASTGGAKSWANGSLGGNINTYGYGGFGGGGSAGQYGGSGGGGYSGGGANTRHGPGGGGSSYNSGASKIETLTATIANGSVVITLKALSISDSAISLTLPNSIAYRTYANVVATASVLGRVTFYANGKRVAGCISLPTISSGTITATCRLRPSTRAPIQLSAQLVPSDSSAYRSSQVTGGTMTVAPRSTPR